MNDRQAKLTLVINSLSGGGAERVFATVVAFLARAHPAFDMSVILLDAAPEHHGLPGKVRKAVLGAGGRMIPSIWRLLLALRESRPDLIVAFLARANCAAILAGRALGIPCLIRECVHTTSHYGDSRAGRINRWIIKKIYPHADAIIAVSHGVRQDLIRNYAVSKDKVVAIYNPIDVTTIRRLAKQPPAQDLPERFMVGVGRLVPNKNFALLLRAYAEARAPEALLLLGVGPEQARLERLAADLGLADSVRFLGYVENPYPIVARAHALLSSSNSEGFPNVLIEALALAIPVVATDCNSGPCEILDETMEQGRVHRMVRAKWGILTPVDCVSSMAEAVREIRSPSLHSRYARAGPERAGQFDRGRIMPEYQGVLKRFL